MTQNNEMDTLPRRHRRRTIGNENSNQIDVPKIENPTTNILPTKLPDDSHIQSQTYINENSNSTLKAKSHAVSIQKDDFDDANLDFPKIEIETSDLYPSSFTFGINNHFNSANDVYHMPTSEPIFNLTNSTMLSEFNRKNKDQNAKTEIDIDNVSIASSFMSEISALAFSSNASACFSASSSNIEKRGLSKHSRTRKSRHKRKTDEDDDFDYRKSLEDPTLPILFQNVWQRKPIWMRNAIICGYKAEIYRNTNNLDLEMSLKENEVERRNRIIEFYSNYHEEEEEKKEVNESIIELNSFLSSTLNQPTKAVFEDEVDLLDSDFEDEISEEEIKLDEKKSFENNYHANPLLILTLAFRFILFIANSLGIC